MTICIGTVISGVALIVISAVVSLAAKRTKFRGDAPTPTTLLRQNST